MHNCSLEPLTNADGIRRRSTVSFRLWPRRSAFLPGERAWHESCSRACSFDSQEQQTQRKPPQMRARRHSWILLVPLYSCFSSSDPAPSSNNSGCSGPGASATRLREARSCPILDSKVPSKTLAVPPSPRWSLLCARQVSTRDAAQRVCAPPGNTVCSCFRRATKEAALVDDLEDGDPIIPILPERIGVWYSYDDQTGGYTSPSPNELTTPSLIDPPRGDSHHAIHFIGHDHTYWGGGVGIAIVSASASECYDAGDFSGFSFGPKAPAPSAHRWVQERSSRLSSGAGATTRSAFARTDTASTCR